MSADGQAPLANGAAHLSIDRGGGTLVHKGGALETSPTSKTSSVSPSKIGYPYRTVLRHCRPTHVNERVALRQCGEPSRFRQRRPLRLEREMPGASALDRRVGASHQVGALTQGSLGASAEASALE